MSKFNTTKVKRVPVKTVNLAGGEAFKQSDKFEFACLLLTSFLKDQFYRSESKTTEDIKRLLKTVSPEFAAKTAIFARNEFGMRSVSHFVASEIGKNVKGEQWTGNFFNNVVRRPDDITEILSCYISQYNKPIPNSMKRGLGKALSRLDEFALAKYKQQGANLSMIDAINIVHPRHTLPLRKLMKGKLAPADTWETKLTQAGQSAENAEDLSLAKSEQWASLVNDGKLGYMALVRNLRNILQYAPETTKEVCEQLVDIKAIKKSLMFPFRFLTAMDIVKQIGTPEAAKVMIALCDAVELSLNNVPKFDGETLVVLDSSGSMSGKPAEIGALFSATLLKANSVNTDFMLFSNDAKYVNINTRDSLITIANNIPFISGGTNFHSIFATANKAYKRIIILSDMQGWIGNHTPTNAYKQYCNQYNVNPKIYSFDLQGYGTLQFPEKNVYCLAGFSDKVFDIMGLLEKDRNALINLIEEVEL